MFLYQKYFLVHYFLQ
ncbi:hypothetical protein Mgra_00008714 [Meloidogyne graminicola]|uniref:Uncharacterized protein n=1 Tax=Meloidogyne graminicola TaxID=189291 RepID=A0A8S9ZF43_9BILA|nr:hypothetical protein Mgra_00008714 [Meloidogyne graminicola]